MAGGKVRLCVMISVLVHAFAVAFACCLHCRSFPCMPVCLLLALLSFSTHAYALRSWSVIAPLNLNLHNCGADTAAHNAPCFLLFTQAVAQAEVGKTLSVQTEQTA